MVQLDFMILEVFSNQNDAMILYACMVWASTAALC